MKKLISTFLVFAVCLGLLSVPLCAQGGQAVGPLGGISPMNVYISRSTNSLDISGGTASCTANMRASSQITKVKIISRLQYQKSGSWVTLETYTDSADTYSVSQYETCSVSGGYQYRLASTFYAYKGGSLVETVQKTYNYDYR